MVNIYEVRERTPFLIQRLVKVWKDSVQATHLFLSDRERNRIKEMVPQALNGVPCLVVAEKDKPVAFIGVDGKRLEMLFLAPGERGAGLGRRLMEYGIERYGIQETTVNEQNPQAVGFYRHMGFTVYQRTPCDEKGHPYPLLYMKRKNDSSII